VLGQFLRVGATGCKGGRAPAFFGRQAFGGSRESVPVLGLVAKSSKAFEAAPSHVTEVEAGLHQLVIAVQHVQRAARRLGRAFELLEHVEDLAILIPPIDLITGLNDGEIFANPVIVAVDGAREAQRRA
jgi:hypothetical protein